MTTTTLPDGAPALIIVRHGETEWSATGKHTGRTDVPLTPAGEEQARQAGRIARALLGDRVPSEVVCSPRSRALRTAELAGFTPTEITEDAAEWDYGALEGRTSPEIRQDQPGWTIWSGEVPGGETGAQVGARADAVLARRDPGGTLVVFSHGHFSRCLAARWLGGPVNYGRFLRLGTGAVNSLGFEHGEPVLVYWNVDDRIVELGS
ncbi:MAG TPA: histidine phosphatase family protein [Jatrophihabitans sp.]|nr:histidine phosphatase family protein [Jatrophihabitans sp.]